MCAEEVLDIVFPGSEYMTNVIIANVETLSHDDSYTLTGFLQTVISLGAMASWPISESVTVFAQLKRLYT